MHSAMRGSLERHLPWSLPMEEDLFAMRRAAWRQQGIVVIRLADLRDGWTRQALDALGGLGSPAGNCVWHVVGQQRSIREWAMLQGWRSDGVAGRSTRNTRRAFSSQRWGCWRGITVTAHAEGEHPVGERTTP